MKKYDKYLTEGKWLANELDKEFHREVSRLSKKMEWDVIQAAAFAVALLEDVNFHDAARVLNDYATKAIEKF